MDRFTVPKLERRIEEIGSTVYRERIRLMPVRWTTAWTSVARSPAFDDSSWDEIVPLDRWGGRDVRATFRTRFSVPREWHDGTVALRAILSRGLHVSGPDATAYLDGRPWQGVDVNHEEVLLPEDMRDGGHVFVLEAYSGTTQRLHEFGGLELVLIDEAARSLYFDAKVALDAAKMLEETSYERVYVINVLDEALRLVDFREPLGAAYRRSLSVARELLARRLYDRDWPGERPTVIGVGHAHIDVAWLWTLEHTRRKTERTFLTALRLMEQFPEYRIVQSQPQLYVFFKQDHPLDYEELRRRVREGRWEATGGMWLESDCNIPCGESLVRQILYGKRFFRSELGVDPALLWLPDAFGYTWALPQIMARAGLKYFMTTKISWNEFNKMPYDSFRWQGIDGTQVLAHFITTPSQSWFATYNGRLTAAEVKGTWDAYKQKRLNAEVLLAFGYGDGGGGPSADMLETARRLKDFPGMPRFRIEKAEKFFERLQGRSAELPVWNGELYLEFHRGTYTSQAQNKRLNRRAEGRFHDAEALSAVATLFGGRYPAAELARGWELILLNQFHDILPGSSIGEVYDESAEQYEEVLQVGDDALEQAMQHLAAQVDTSGEELAVIIVNTLGWDRCGVVEMTVPKSVGYPVVSCHGRRVPAQLLECDGQSQRVLFYAEDVPAYGWKLFSLASAQTSPEPRMMAGDVKAGARSLENRFFSLTFDQAGRLTSLRDKRRQREVLAEGGLGNEFVLFEDKPLNNDAWNIDVFYQEKSWVLDDEAEFEVIENGPVRAGLEIRRSFLHSTMSQRVYVYSELPRIDFETEVDWHERHLLLKVAFPVAVHNNRATYEIQFGHIERPTHWNTSWDWARFEVPAQRWADLSEGDYGVSLLNDCKYGYDIRGNVMRLTLIKSATSPDDEADQGRHAFTYSLYPHDGDWRNGTLQQAAALNTPLLARVEDAHPGEATRLWSFVSSSADNVIVDTVKKAEDSDWLVVRVYEAYGQRGHAVLRFGKTLVDAVECNLMEEDEQPVTFDEGSLSFDYRPYEIRTFRVRFG